MIGQHGQRKQENLNLFPVDSNEVYSGIIVDNCSTSYRHLRNDSYLFLGNRDHRVIQNEHRFFLQKIISKRKDSVICKYCSKYSYNVDFTSHNLF